MEFDMPLTKETKLSHEEGIPIANVLDCDIVVSKFKLKLHYYVYFHNNTFGKGNNLLSPAQLWVK